MTTTARVPQSIGTDLSNDPDRAGPVESGIAASGPISLFQIANQEGLDKASCSSGALNPRDHDKAVAEIVKRALEPVPGKNIAIVSTGYCLDLFLVGLGEGNRIVVSKEGADSERSAVFRPVVANPANTLEMRTNLRNAYDAHRSQFAFSVADIHTASFYAAGFTLLACQEASPSCFVALAIPTIVERLDHRLIYAEVWIGTATDMRHACATYAPLADGKSHSYTIPAGRIEAKVIGATVESLTLSPPVNLAV